MVDNNDTFEIGLVMAGAVSAGAYTAGVVDYLLEALQHYEKVRRRFAEEHPDQSLHNVQIRLCSGASAGGMIGTMLLSAMMDTTYKPMSGYHPNTVTRPDIAANVFYRSWVDSMEGIDISYLLDNSDVTGKKPLLSLLNCNRLDKIANNALCHPREIQSHDYIPNRFDHFVSVFNMNGVPYTVQFDESNSEYGMVNHSDMMHFVLDRNKSAAFTLNEIALSEEASASLNPNWKLLRQSTLATGAFPLALEPRQLERSRDAYNEWEWWVPESNESGGCSENGRCFSLQGIKPGWPADQLQGQYVFVSVDGGVANNEPLEIARRALAGKDKFNPRGKDEAHRAILLIDPFPAEPFEDKFTIEGLNLFKSAARLFSSLKMQARFKPDELEVARNPDIFSRFIIAPSRDGAHMGFELASASLGSFGGFLSEKFRQHDFQLGRNNCQSFLMNHFAIGIDNPLVSNHLAWFRDNGCVVRNNKGEEMVQIIPMANLPGDRITTSIDLISFESIKMTADEFTKLIKQIENRITTVLEKSYIINKFINGVSENVRIPGLKWVANNFLKQLRNAITSFIVSKTISKIEKTISDNLKGRELL